MFAGAGCSAVGATCPPARLRAYQVVCMPPCRWLVVAIRGLLAALALSCQCLVECIPYIGKGHTCVCARVGRFVVSAAAAVCRQQAQLCQKFCLPPGVGQWVVVCIEPQGGARICCSVGTCGAAGCRGVSAPSSMPASLREHFCSEQSESGHCTYACVMQGGALDCLVCKAPAPELQQLRQSLGC